MKFLDAAARKPDSGFWSSRIARTDEDEEDALAPPSLPAPASPLRPAEPDSDSEVGVISISVGLSVGGAGVARMRLNSLRALSRSGTFRIPKAIVSCVEIEGNPRGGKERGSQ